MNIVIIDGTKKAPCSVCGRVEELRPYGRDGAFVCFECAMKDEAEADRQLMKLLSDKRAIVVIK